MFFSSSAKVVFFEPLVVVVVGCGVVVAVDVTVEVEVVVVKSIQMDRIT